MFDIFYKGVDADSIADAAHKSKTKFFWYLDPANNYVDFDFFWVPNVWEEQYVHVFPSQHQRDSGTYFVNKNSYHEKMYHLGEQQAKRMPNPENWIVPKDIDPKTVDFSWHPDPADPPYIYHFTSVHQRASGLKYVVPGAVNGKFVSPFKVEFKPSEKNWHIPDDVEKDSIDFTWRPDALNMPLNYIFPTEYNRASGVEYRVPGAERMFFVRPFHVKHKPDETRWEIPEDIDRDSVDFTWRPNAHDPDYVYHFPTKYNRSSGVKYFAGNSNETKFTDAFRVAYKESRENWHIPSDVDVRTVDFTWRPDSMDDLFVYHFPTKFQRASGVTFSVPGATANKYVSPFTVKHLINKSNWVIPEDIVNPNLTWRPDPTDPPYIYKFPSEYVRESGLEYHVPGATEEKFVDDIRVSFDAEALPRYYIETTIEDLIAEHKDEVFWALNKEMDYAEFDFSWHPDNTQRDYLHVFGSQWQKHSQTYYIDGPGIGTQDLRYNFVGDQTVKANSNIDIFYIDKSNPGSADRYKELSKTFKTLKKVRYVNNIFDTIKRCSTKSQSSKFWVITSENDYSEFNFDWHAEPWQNYMFHVFGTKEQKWSDTYLVNKYIFDDHCRWVKDIKNMPDLNFVDDQIIKAINVNDIYVVDFGNEHKTTVEGKNTRFIDSFLSVIKRITAHSTSEYIWITSTISDYSNFNFDWRPEPYQAEMLHVFGPGNQKFGDTFLVHVPSFKKQADRLELLDWYETVNYCNEQIVPRLPYDVVEYASDDLTSEIKNHKFSNPYALFYPQGASVGQIDYNPSVWREKDRAIHTFTESGSIVLAPKDTIQYLGSQCYDYPYIKRQNALYLDEKPLDIVFVSNGESTAEALYERLRDVTAHDPLLTVKRVDGVNGRAAAYKACAEISDTDWFFNVFAKLEVDADFDWHWQPDRLQEPKHYIFHAKNPVNGLVYGHQAMIAYNKKLVLNTNEWGLDFTLSQEHEVVPILSGIARYDSDAWTTWRTAFREAIKLLADDTDISKERLLAWSKGSNGEFGIESTHAVQDAIQYFNEVEGDHDKLLLSFEWDWLREYYEELGY